MAGFSTPDSELSEGVGLKISVKMFRIYKKNDLKQVRIYLLLKYPTWCGESACKEVNLDDFVYVRLVSLVSMLCKSTMAE